MRKLLTMLAHAQGGLANLSRFAAALGLSQPTVVRYVDILEQSFLLRRLPPYFRNVGKRLVKSPKLYLRDTGLLHHLLNIDSLAVLDSHPIRGASWETFVLEDLLRREAVAYPHGVAHFWRTAGGAEVDLLLERGADLHALEIKTSRASSPYLARGLRAIVDDTGAVGATIIDQGPGIDPLAPGVTRRGFAESTEWLPVVEAVSRRLDFEFLNVKKSQSAAFFASLARVLLVVCGNTTFQTAILTVGSGKADAFGCNRTWCRFAIGFGAEFFGHVIAPVLS